MARRTSSPGEGTSRHVAATAPAVVVALRSVPPALAAPDLARDRGRSVATRRPRVAGVPAAVMTPAIGVAAGRAAAKAAAEYYLERQISELTQRTAAYYARNEQANSAAIEAGQGCAVAARPDMPPDVAKALGLDPTKPVTLDELTNLLAGLRADGAEIEGSQRGVGTYKASEPGAKDRHRIAYLDLTISASKSVSLAWAFSETEAERAAILEAHKTAVQETLRYVEEQVGWARTGERRGGAAGTCSVWLAVAGALHLAADAGDGMRRSGNG